MNGRGDAGLLWMALAERDRDRDIQAERTNEIFIYEGNGIRQ